MLAFLVGSSEEVGDGGFSCVSREVLVEEREGVGEECIVGVKVMMKFWIFLGTAVFLSPRVDGNSRRPQDVGLA